MAVPALVLPNDETILPASGSDLDGWALKVNLDPSKDWSGSTFTADAPFSVDATHKASSPPYVLVHISAAALLSAGAGVLTMRLAESTVLARTFLEQTVTVVPR